MADSKLIVNPTGCPGPIPGTKVWRCDGTNCIYGASQYASCKTEIELRGYELRITDDIIVEAREASELLTKSVQQELDNERKARLNEQYAFAAELEDKEQRIQELEKQLKELQDNAEQNKGVVSVAYGNSGDGEHMPGGDGNSIGYNVEDTDA